MRELTLSEGSLFVSVPITSKDDLPKALSTAWNLLNKKIKEQDAAAKVAKEEGLS